MERKIFKAPLVLKAEGDGGEAGQFTAVFSTFNVIDHHGDVTVPGAFKEQSVVVEPWNHGWTLPAGKGVVKSDGEKAWVEGQFFMDTEVGREHYATVKGLGEMGEWSYTFDIEEAGQGDFEGQQVQFLRKLDVVGVGPVTRGAGITRTVTIKKKDSAQGEGEDGGGTDGTGAVKPSGPDAGSPLHSESALLTRINSTEVGIIYLEVGNE